ncbi:hypothetical protein B0H13DRAFT_2317760 [Mycena leptocephala]|nr:hypothetical protein B0H13DRAFT_2317760 [Mycena leptocephala]
MPLDPDLVHCIIRHTHPPLTLDAQQRSHHPRQWIFRPPTDGVRTPPLAHVSSVTPIGLDLTPCTYASASLSAQLRLAFRPTHAPALVTPPLPQLWLSLAYVPLG